MSKSSGLTCALVAIALAWSYHVYAGAESAQDVWGPYNCPTCTLSTPMPDVGTKAFIQTMELSNYYGVGMLVYRATGDKYIICNGSYCATYTRTDDKDRFIGGDVVRQQTARERMSRESSGRQGGYGGGGGVVGSGGLGNPSIKPKVTLGDPVKITN